MLPRAMWPGAVGHVTEGEHGAALGPGEDFAGTDSTCSVSSSYVRREWKDQSRAGGPCAWSTRQKQTRGGSGGGGGLALPESKLYRISIFQNEKQNTLGWGGSADCKQTA